MGIYKNFVASDFVQPKSSLNQLIDVIQEDQDVDIVLLHRANNGIPEVHPDGEIIVHDGDTIVLFANHDKITEIVSRNEASHAHKGR